MLTDLEIVNNALGRLGVERVISLSDDNKRAKIAKDFLDASRRFTLEMTPWDFALKIVELTSTGAPAFGYTHQVALPADWLKAVKEENGYEYFVMGSNLVSDYEVLQMTYIYEIDEDVKRTPNFDKAWYLNLAAEMSYSLTQNSKLKNDLIAEADLVAGRAGSLNAMGSTPTSYEIDDYTNSRL